MKKFIYPKQFIVSLFALLLFYSGSLSAQCGTATPVQNTNTGVWYANIQSAINAASANDIIFACPGIYTENIVLNKSVTLRGAQWGVDARTRIIGVPNPFVE